MLFAGLAMTVREGLWSNTLTLINIIISGLVAFGFYSPLVVYLDEEVTDGQHTYWLDFAIIWALFCVTMVILPLAHGRRLENADAVQAPDRSRRRTDRGFIAAWVLAAFTLATLHTSPMPKDAFGGKLVYTDVDSASSITSARRGLAAVCRDDVASRQHSVPARPISFSAEGFREDLRATAAKNSTKRPALIVKRG